MGAVCKRGDYGEQSVREGVMGHYYLGYYGRLSFYIGNFEEGSGALFYMGYFESHYICSLIL